MYTIVKDFVVNSYSLDLLSDKYDLPKSKIIQIIREFADKTQNPKTSLVLKDKLAKHIIKDFMNYTKSIQEFSKEYGMTQKAFKQFILTSVNDNNLIQSDNLANTIYRRLISKGIRLLVSETPERIINYVALAYISDNTIKQSEIAANYRAEGKTVGKMLKRGIAENIIPDDIAEAIYYKVNKCAYSSSESLTTLEEAFEKREVTKLKQNIHFLEMQLESDDENINYSKLQETLDKLKARLALCET